MGTGDRRAKVTPETKEEARRLRELWDAGSHPGQAEFGEKYGIGNQSAVSQFLRGAVPLSLNAARGFAQGLGCRIEDFSPRLAAEAAAISNVEGAPSPEVTAYAEALRKLPPRQRQWLVEVMTFSIESAWQAANMNGQQVAPDQAEPADASTKRVSRAS